jgi:DNA-binding transcriptional LysR family regulator
MRGNQFAELNAFMAVAEHASFTKAAGQLALSPATMSYSIRALEERLRVRLLNRTTRSVALTEAGEVLQARLRPLFDDFAAAVESVSVFRDNPAGRLRLTVPPPVATFVLRCSRGFTRSTRTSRWKSRLTPPWSRWSRVGSMPEFGSAGASRAT